MVSKMNVGVIGIGYWGSKVVREYIDLVKEGEIEGVGVCDVREDVLKNLKDSENVIKISNDYKEFLKDDAIDAVHICTNNVFHYDVAKEALQNGKHVLLEKPMTTNANKAYELVELSAHNGLILQVGHIFRFANVTRKAKQLVDERYFGKIYYLTLKWTTLMPPIQNVDIIWDLLPHPLDIIHFLTGKWPHEWQVMARFYRRDKLNEMVFINLDYEDFVANVELSWVTPERKRIMEIVGSDRMAKVECVKQKMHVFEGKERDFDVEIEANNTIREEAINFIESIKNRRMPFNSHIIGAKNVDVIEKIMKSI
ncbi:MAG TPA: Gfo/Idh/MocA family oxidoreductase [Thermoplasmatales archaeon]|nr:Gfo/Idh/MocA family oxidoreductase [Thermoplasmatales archaeon]